VAAVSSLRLEPFADEHVPHLDALVADEDVLRFTRIPVPPPPGFGTRWVERYRQGRLDGTSEAFAVLDDHGSFLGAVMAPTIDAETRTMELGYVISPHARGRGVATEGLRLLTEWAFEQGAERLELLIAPDNPASRRVAERCGYRLEGVMRSVYFKQGERADTELWSKLPTDP
jgi:RimJ/RimL family protein N-acetyltransferase